MNRHFNIVSSHLFLLVACASLLLSSCHQRPKPAENLKEMAYGHLLARAIHQAAYFSIADEVDGNTTVETIAHKLNLEADALHRIINVLVNHGIFARNHKGLVEHTPLSEPLRSQAHRSLRAALAKEFDHRRWSALGHLDIALTTGASPFNTLYGEGFYAYLENNPKAASLFNAGMSGFSEQEDQAIAAQFDFSAYGKIFDIGGGNGGLLSAILKQFPHAHGTLFDLKDAVEKSPLLKDEQFKGRTTGLVGDFFVSIPQGGELYILKRVIHNWDNEKSLQIMSNCRKAIGNQSARLVIIEKLLPEKPDGSLLVDTDLIALAFGDGRERNEKEFRDLAYQTGFMLERIEPTKAGVSIMVLKPIDK